MEENTETTTEETTVTEEATGAEAADLNLKTAFVVAIDPDGRVYLELNTDSLTIPVERPATLIEVRRYLSEILMDLQAQAAAEYTVGALTQRVAQPSEEPTAE
jgi:hypothetical protein